MFSRYFGCFSVLICAILILDSHANAAMTREQMEKAGRGMRNVCQPKTGVDTALLDGMNRGEFPPDPKLQCYAKCVMSMIKSFKNGKPVLDVLLKQITIMMPADIQERNTEVAKYCVTLNFDADPCVAAWEFVKCQYERAPDLFYFP